MTGRLISWGQTFSHWLDYLGGRRYVEDERPEDTVPAKTDSHTTDGISPSNNSAFLFYLKNITAQPPEEMRQGP